MSKPTPLTETYAPSGPLKIVEETADGTLRASGPFAAVGVPTKNGRVYNRPIWESSLKRLGPVIEKSRLAGELDHPDDGRTRATRISHMITGLRIVESADGGAEVYGDLTVFDTPNGQTVKALIKGGYGLGVSSRGRGSLKKRPDGFEEVMEDFVLQTFDLVVDPAASNAYPAFFESTESQVLLSIDVNEDATVSPVAVLGATGALEPVKSAEDIEKEIRAKVADELASAMAEFRKQAFESAKKEVQSTTDGGARQALESVVTILAPFFGHGAVIGDKLNQCQVARSSLAVELEAEKKKRADIEESAAAAINKASLALAIERAVVSAVSVGMVETDVRRALASASPATPNDVAEAAGKLTCARVESVTTSAHKALQEHADATRKEVIELKRAIGQCRVERSKLSESLEEMKRKLVAEASTNTALRGRAELAESKLRHAADSGDKLIQSIIECESDREVSSAIRSHKVASEKPLAERFPKGRSGLHETFARIYRSSSTALSERVVEETTAPGVDDDLDDGLKEAVQLTGMSPAAALGRSRL